MEARAEASRQRLQTARADVAKAGVAPTDPQARRLAAVLPGVSEEAVQLYQPLVLPVAISVLGILMIAAGAHKPKRRKPVKAKGKKRLKAPKPKPPSAQVIPLRRKRA
jgi:hypothetical protein